jgi:hypothetical protein
MDKLQKHSTAMADLRKHYVNCFADIFSEADLDDVHQEAVIESFLTALDEWLIHHVNSANRYKQMRERVRQALGMSELREQ